MAKAFEHFLDGFGAASVGPSAPELDLSDAEITEIPYLGEGARWKDAAERSGVSILSERALNIPVLYDPMEYSYSSPHTGRTVWAYVRTSSGSDSDCDCGVYANRQLNDAEATQVLR
jgi:hypothetical protein